MNWNEFLKIFNDCELNGNKIIIKSKLNDAIRFIKENYSFSMLKEIVAVDKNEEGIELIYHLYSVDNEEDLYIAIAVQDEAESVIDLFESAVPDENEIYDMFGIKFLGNENLKRLYMPKDWKGFPLRKDYVQDDTRLAWNDNNKA